MSFQDKYKEYKERQEAKSIFVLIMINFLTVHSGVKLLGLDY